MRLEKDSFNMSFSVISHRLLMCLRINEENTKL